MKQKLFFTVFLILELMSVSNVSAQFAESTNVTKSKMRFRKTADLGLELGIGNIEKTEGLILDIGMHYLYRFSPNVGWDIISAKVITNSEDFNLYSAQGMMGIQVNTPSFSSIANRFFYLNARFGYGYNHCASANASGFCYECGCGFYISNHLSLGYAYNFQKVKDNIYFIEALRQNYHSLKIGYNF